MQSRGVLFPYERIQTLVKGVEGGKEDRAYIQRTGNLLPIHARRFRRSGCFVSFLQASLFVGGPWLMGYVRLTESKPSNLALFWGSFESGGGGDLQ